MMALSCETEEVLANIHLECHYV